MSIQLFEVYLKNKTMVTLREIRREFGDDAMKLFLENHDKLGFEFCHQCHVFARMEPGSVCENCMERIRKAEEALARGDYEEAAQLFDDTTGRG